MSDLLCRSLFTFCPASGMSRSCSASILFAAACRQNSSLWCTSGMRHRLLVGVVAVAEGEAVGEVALEEAEAEGAAQYPAQ